MTHSPAETSRPTRATVRTFAIRLVINAAVPVLVYLLLRPHVHSDLVALAIGAAIPTAYTVVVLVMGRRLDPIGIIAIVCFCVGLLIAVATGGNELVFKLREDFWTGPVGLACLLSVPLRKPLFYLALRFAARRNPQIAERVHRPQTRRIATVTTLVVGAILLVHAVAMVAIALTTSTATYLAISRPITWAIIAAGILPLVWWIRQQRINPAGRAMSR